MSFKIHTEGTYRLRVERKERWNLREQKLGGPLRPREWRNQEFLEFLDNGNEGSSNGALVVCKTLF